jgi:uncharacterized protein (DUF2225 family)
MPEQPTSSWESVLTTCPACNRGFLEQRLSPHSYRVVESDTDFYPAKKIWKSAELSNFSPLSYFMQTCPGCHFTVEANGSSFYQDPSHNPDNPQLRLQVERHAAELAYPDSLIGKLVNRYGVSKQNFERVVIRFLLGIYDEKLKDYYSNYNLGRYYLRLGWVFRENRNLNLTRHSEDLTALQKNLEDLADRQHSYLDQIEKLKDTLDRNFLTLSGESSPAIDSERLFQMLIEKLNQQVLPAGENTEHLLEQLRQKASLNGSFEAADPEAQVSLASYLLDLKTIWPGVPLNETEALKIAVSYYHQYFDSLPKGASTGPKLQTAYLIGELWRRVGDYDMSRKFFSLAITLADQCVRKETESYRSAFARKITDLANQQLSLAETQQTQIG